uniref:hypothetical protein n=1 Tax=Coprococcus sp. TaxID=2049024 RepID=UPI0040291A98
GHILYVDVIYVYIYTSIHHNKYTVLDTKKQEVTERGRSAASCKKMRGERIQINEKLFTIVSISRICEKNVFKD